VVGLFFSLSFLYYLDLKPRSMGLDTGFPVEACPVFDFNICFFCRKTACLFLCPLRVSMFAPFPQME